MKELKERFSRWFNKQNGRRGTLWMARFKKVCVDGEAAGGSKRARRGLCKAWNLPRDCWEGRGVARYRIFLFDEGFSVEPESPSFTKGVAFS
ncbi:MAG: putative transposase [Paracoccaceae bacterium]